jgi:outer membrane protein OmpA-like peptidoglycan-associated protein
MVPTRTPTPTLPATVTADAPGDIIPLQGGLRLTFGPGRADLNPGTEAAIRALVHGGGTAGPASDNSSFTITTYAAGSPDDPSTARRLSLARALAVRSVLIAQGIASPRIYPKAWGPNQPGFNDGPPDRADITIATNPVPNVTAKPR